MTEHRDLLSVPPRWVTLTSESTEDAGGLRLVTLVDEAVATGAPWEGFGLQVGIGTPLRDVDSAGQPTADEKADLRPFEQALVDAVGDQGRLVSTTTLDGQREYLLYLRAVDVLLPWQDSPPPAMAARDWGVRVLVDPTWLGLREVAGLLQPGEEHLPPLQELGPPAAES